MKRGELESKLAAAKAGRAPVRITSKLETGWANGYVVGASERWLLLLLIGDGIAYAGFQAYRLQDVAAIENPAPHADFYQAALRKRGQRRPRLPKIDLSSTGALIRSVSEHSTLITIHREKVNPGCCQIGQFVESSSTWVSLWEVTPDATWDDAPTKYRLAEITRVDFGGPYEEALALVAVKPSPRARKSIRA